MTQLELAEQYVTTTNVSLFLTGKAGTGKTTFLHHIVASTKKRCVVLAPTGVAAVNAGGVTIHSFFQLPLCPYLPEVKELVTEYQLPERKFKSLRKDKVRLIRSLDLIIIDEISMVRADLLDAVDMTLQRYRRSGKPFGGVQLLMIGDVQQLPPVVTEEEKPYIEQVYSSPFFFNSKALQRLDYTTIVLTKIFRQQDEDFIALLNAIRDNRFDKNTLTTLNTRYQPGFNPPDSEGYIRLTTHNRQSNYINQQKLAAIRSTPFELKASIEGNFPETSYPTDALLTLKRGAQVMFVKNDSNGHEYYNGKLATVEGYDSEEGIAVVDTEGNHILVKHERWENIKYQVDPKDGQIKQEVDGTFVQYPLRLAWAITIHKSQGLTFDKVIVDAASSFTYGQVYVALSRCRSLQGLVLATPISEHCAFDSPDVFNFNHSLPPPETAAQLLEASQSHYFAEQVYELFDFSQLHHDAERLNSLFQQHLRRLFPQQMQKMSELTGGPLVDMLSVSERFKRQLVRMQMQSNQSLNHPLILDRIAKGSEYFDDQLQQLLLVAAPLLEIKPGNKNVAADFEEYATDFVNDIELKQMCFKRVVAQGFSIDNYNQAKRDFLLEKEQATSSQKVLKRWKVEKKKVGKAPKESKPPKEPAWFQSVSLFSKGMSMNEIAKAQNLKPATVESHLISAFASGAITVDKLMTSEELDAIVEFILDQHPTSLKEIYQYFDGLYSYLKIRAATIVAKEL